jgi:uncharacterized damage-inducible protein DinB
MRTLLDLYAYNTWANAKVFAVCRDADQARLDADAPGTIGSITETLKHLIQVEFVYWMMLRDKPPVTGAARDEFLAHDLTWYGETAARLGQDYATLLAGASAAFYDEPLPVPWFEFALTKHDGLLQVLHHSAQHRAQVLSVLGQHGVEVPDMDYVFFVESKLPGGA